MMSGMNLLAVSGMSGLVFLSLLIVSNFMLKILMIQTHGTVAGEGLVALMA